MLVFRILLVVSYEAAVLDRRQGEHHVYSKPQEEVIQHSAFQGEVFGLPVRLDHQGNPKGNVSSSVQWPSGLRLQSDAWIVQHDNKQGARNARSELTRAYDSVTV